MNAWLVVARCALDDIPLGLERDEVKARQLANIYEVKDVLKRARSLGLDTSIVYSISILEFRGGVPFGDYTIIQDLEGKGNE